MWRSESSGLRIINITNPAAPTLAGFYDTPGYAYGVAVSGNYAYVADGSQRLADPQHHAIPLPRPWRAFTTPHGGAFGRGRQRQLCLVAD